MTSLSQWRLVLLIAALAACDRGAQPDASASPPQTVTLRLEDSPVIEVVQPTLIGFHPLVSDSMLERDENLATVLDDFGYHLSSAMDSLRAQGFVVDTRITDTLYFRSAGRSWSWVRADDSARVGYVLTMPSGQVRTIYGVRTNIDLITVADSFARTSPR